MAVIVATLFFVTMTLPFLYISTFYIWYLQLTLNRSYFLLSFIEPQNFSRSPTLSLSLFLSFTQTCTHSHRLVNIDLIICCPLPCSPFRYSLFSFTWEYWKTFIPFTNTNHLNQLSIWNFLQLYLNAGWNSSFLNVCMA